MSKFRWLFAVAGAVVGLVTIAIAHNVTAQIQPLGQPLPARSVVQTCNVTPAFGVFKGVWGEWLVFEDAAGTLRSVNAACEIRHTVARQ